MEFPEGANKFLEVQDFHSLAYIYAQLGSMEKADEVIKKGLIVFDENPDLLFERSIISEDSNEDDIKIYNTILRQEFTYEPFSFDYATVYNNLAWAYCLQGNYEKGLPHSLKSVQLDASHDYSWETLGEIYFYLGRYQDCINAMTKCIEISPNYKSAYKFRGNAKIKLGKKKDGEKDLQTAETLIGD